MNIMAGGAILNTNSSECQHFFREKKNIANLLSHVIFYPPVRRSIVAFPRNVYFWERKIRNPQVSSEHPTKRKKYLYRSIHALPVQLLKTRATIEDVNHVFFKYYPSI